MNYLDKVANGNAGEYYFAYWVSRHFQWPCRLLDIDVGIDAQIEIFDEKQHSVGNFIAVQVKTTLSNNPNVSVSLNNLQYWKSIEDVIVIVSISFSNNEPVMYWKLINDKSIDTLITQAKENKSETATVEFKDSNKLIIESKTEFELLPYRGADACCSNLIIEMMEECDGFNDMFWSKSNPEYDVMNLEVFDVDEPVELYDRICKLNDKLEGLMFKMPKIRSRLDNIESKDESMSLARKNLISYVDFQLNSEFAHEYSSNWRTHRYHQEILEIVDDCS